MLNLKSSIAGAVILLSALLPVQTGQGDAIALLHKVRDIYQSLRAYHFERVLVIQEAGSDRKLANIADLTLTLATENAEPTSDRPFPPINLDRVRLGTKTKRGEQLQVCGGGTCWSYSSVENEYMTGKRFRDVNTSVGGSMAMAFHLFTFAVLEDGTVQNAKIVRQEEIQVGNERRKCDVIEGEIQTVPLLGPGGAKKPPSLASLGAFWLVSAVTLQGLAESGRGTRYSPWLDEKMTDAAEPTRVTLWIDRSAHAIVRSRMDASLYKRAAGAEQPEKVAVTVTDNFTIARMEAPTDETFRFTPPDGAKEVPNIASHRDKQR